MTHFVLSILLHFHLAIVPVFKPELGGFRTAHVSISNGPDWDDVFHKQEIQQPDGALFIAKYKF